MEEDEYVETINKLGANVRCIDAAEGEFVRNSENSGHCLTTSFSEYYAKMVGTV